MVWFDILSVSELDDGAAGQVRTMVLREGFRALPYSQQLASAARQVPPVISDT